MTTLATGERAPGRAGGFSLFEVLVVLAIISLFTSFFLLRFDDGATEEALTHASNSLRAAALKAKKRAYTFRRHQYIIFNPGGFVLTEQPPGDAYAPPPRGGGESKIYHEAFSLPEGLKMELRPPGAEKWTTQPGVFWVFRSSGLSDPMTVRFSMGRSYTTLNFNVLTALAEEETFIE